MFRVRSRDFVAKRGLVVITNILNRLMNNMVFEAWKLWKEYVRF